MKKVMVFCIVATMVTSNPKAFGHGIPITVSVDENNKLIASNEQPLYSPIDLTSGYAPMVLVDNEDVAAMSQVTFSNSNPLGLLGSYNFTTLPGFSVTGMDAGSGLFLQVIPRPVMGTNPVSLRTLWHWSLGSGQVALDPSNESLTIASDPDGGVLSASFPQAGSSSPTIKVAQPLGSELGTHQHYLEYFLGNSPQADTGLFGFFARLTSPNYFSSNPFLVILDNGVYEDDNPGQILAGALSINNAALLAGDYNHDDRVDAADYVLWRKTVGSTSTFAADGTGDKVVDLADYNVWRRNLGLTVPANGLGVGSVPEPTSALLLVIGLAGFSRFSRSSRSRARVLG
jgi:hypothetical protein